MRRSLLVALVVAAVLGLLLFRTVPPPRPAARGAFGSGPTVVFVHGLGSRADHWLATARILARKHRVVLVDLPGHGASEMPQPLTLERAAQSLDEALAEDGNGPVVLVGHSLGGLVAAAEALAHPERVRALVLVETALKPQLDPDERDKLLRDLDTDYQETLHAAYRSYGRNPAQGEALYQEVAALDPRMVKSWIQLALAADLSIQINRLVPRLLAVLTTRSWPDGEPWSETAHALGYEGVPRLETERLTGCGHFIMLDRPDDLAKLIERAASGPDAKPVGHR